ncbi:MAG: metalloregulator ArsR/SmtB family transcription factor [bacterium]|nr:metalloregulator ArsR/SmtB family transcription factor [bacterium]
MKEDLAIFKAFADETRLRILFLLSQRELCVCELVTVLDMPQGKISRHLAVLKHANLVSDRRDGTWIYYSLLKPDNSLKRRLHTYLKHDREDMDLVLEDLHRLDKLADAGTICIPQPAFVRAVSQN